MKRLFKNPRWCELVARAYYTKSSCLLWALQMLLQQ